MLHACVSRVSDVVVVFIAFNHFTFFRLKITILNLLLFIYLFIYYHYVTATAMYAWLCC